MSQENVEIVKGIYSRWENGDFAHTEWAAPDFEFRAEETSPHGAPRTDLAGMQIQWRDFLEAWADVRASPDEIIEAGDRVVVLTRFSGRGKVSGVPMEQMEAGAVFTMSEGKVVQLVLYTSRSKALEAAGLSERDGP